MRATIEIAYIIARKAMFSPRSPHLVSRIDPQI